MNEAMKVCFFFLKCLLWSLDVLFEW